MTQNFQLQKPLLSQVRLKPGDLCQLCLQATALARRRFWQQPRPDPKATSAEICGVNEAKPMPEFGVGGGGFNPNKDGFRDLSI